MCAKSLGALKALVMLSPLMFMIVAHEPWYSQSPCHIVNVCQQLSPLMFMMIGLCVCVVCCS